MRIATGITIHGVKKILARTQQGNRSGPLILEFEADGYQHGQAAVCVFTDDPSLAERLAAAINDAMKLATAAE